jgi:hypothetical protein
MRLPRVWLGAGAAVALLVQPASAQSLTGLDNESLTAIEDQVARIRGLAPLWAPDLRLLDHASLTTYLADQFATNYPPNERESDQKEYVALGLIQPTDDLYQIQLNLLSDQVIGIYDSDTRALFVVDDDGGFGPAARITYAHEFNHALQDQYYGLTKIAPRHPDSNDRSLAVHALIEGDAIMLQTIWARQNMSPDELAQLARVSASSSNDVLAGVPLIVRTELLFPYTDGLNFVRQAYHQAGDTYVAIDRLFKNPPESTAQVLHADKYRGQVHPVSVEVGDLATSLGPGWRTVGSGVLGELDTRVLLEQWGTGRIEAGRVAAGWSGDRWQLVESDGHDTLALKSTWESPAAASDFFDAYTHGLRGRFDNAETEATSGTRQALTTPGTATDVRLQGSDVLVVIAFDRQTANAVVEAVTFAAV